MAEEMWTYAMEEMSYPDVKDRHYDTRSWEY
jgi:hypothetical protein